jgi:hypothetical protein
MSIVVEEPSSRQVIIDTAVSPSRRTGWLRPNTLLVDRRVDSLYGGMLLWRNSDWRNADCG